MKEVDISNIEELILAKVSIENKLKENDPEYKAMTLEDFVSNYIALTDVLVDDGEIIPFSLKDIDGEKYLMYSAETDKSYDKIKSHLKEIGYDLSNLRELPYSEMVMKLDELKTYYMIGGKFYVE